MNYFKNNIYNQLRNNQRNKLMILWFDDNELKLTVLIEMFIGTVVHFGNILLDLLRAPTILLYKMIYTCVGSVKEKKRKTMLMTPA